jgi:hypothetical protein
MSIDANGHWYRWDSRDLVLHWDESTQTYRAKRGSLLFVLFLEPRPQLLNSALAIVRVYVDCAVGDEPAPKQSLLCSCADKGIDINNAAKAATRAADLHLQLLALEFNYQPR